VILPRSHGSGHHFTLQQTGTNVVCTVIILFSLSLTEVLAGDELPALSRLSGVGRFRSPAAACIIAGAASLKLRPGPPPFDVVSQRPMPGSAAAVAGGGSPFTCLDALCPAAGRASQNGLNFQRMAAGHMRGPDPIRAAASLARRLASPGIWPSSSCTPSGSACAPGGSGHWTTRPALAYSPIIGRCRAISGRAAVTCCCAGGCLEAGGSQRLRGAGWCWRPCRSPNAIACGHGPLDQAARPPPGFGSELVDLRKGASCTGAGTRFQAVEARAPAAQSAAFGRSSPYANGCCGVVRPGR